MCYIFKFYKPFVTECWKIVLWKGRKEKKFVYDALSDWTLVKMHSRELLSMTESMFKLQIIKSKESTDKANNTCFNLRNGVILSL